MAASAGFCMRWTTANPQVKTRVDFDFISFQSRVSSFLLLLSHDQHHLPKATRWRLRDNCCTASAVRGGTESCEVTRGDRSFSVENLCTNGSCISTMGPATSPVAISAMEHESADVFLLWSDQERSELARANQKALYSARNRAVEEAHLAGHFANRVDQVSSRQVIPQY